MVRAREGPHWSPPHRVGRLRFEIDGADEAALLRLRAEIAGGVESWVPKALDAAFEPFERPGHTIRVEQLEVDLGPLPAEGLTPARLSEAVRISLSECLDALAPLQPAAPEPPSERRTLAEAFHAFLESGRLPWWSPAASLPEIETEIRRMKEPALRALAQVSASALYEDRGARRLVLQVEPRAAAAVAGALAGARAAGIETVAWPTPVPAHAAEIEALVTQVRTAVGPGAKRAETGEASEAEVTAPPSIVEPRPPIKAARADFAEDLPAPSIDTVIAITDAGLVLVHPFLPALFAARGLATGGRFAGKAEQQRAVHLVAYLATGEAARSEPELVLPKLLCGWPLDEPLPRSSLLGPGDGDEAEILLRDIIGHWTALGRASPEALRETFLLRPGRLLETPGTWRIEAERRGTDVLLGRLPWTLSPVRLPWMARPIFVDWA